jgi:GT2 family glycosyltransferase
MQNPKLSIVIVSWNVREQLKENLNKLFAQNTLNSFEVIVVDNGSEDETVQMLRSDFPQVQIIENASNRGFAFASNQGLRLAVAEVLVLFNPDMIMGDGVLDHTYATLTQNKNIGVLGVNLKYPNGETVASVRRDPSLKDQLAILLKLPHLFPSIADKYLAKDFDYTKSQNVEQIRGSYFAFRRDVMEEVGLLDEERFFIWFEEVDFCKRVRKAGYIIWYDAKVSCTDLVGQSFKQQSVALKQARFSKSMARYFQKWHSPASALIIHALRPFVISTGVVVDVIRSFSKNKNTK